MNGNRRVDLSRLEVDQTWPWLRRGEAWRGAIRWRGGGGGSGLCQDSFEAGVGPWLAALDFRVAKTCNLGLFYGLVSQILQSKIFVFSPGKYDLVKWTHGLSGSIVSIATLTTRRV